jgi:general secretion pathway protein A
MNCNQELPYLDFLGLNRNPFPVTPDADDFFESTDTETIITELVHGINTRKGFFVLTGEVGVGKTTISRRILQLLNEENIQTSLVFHSLLPKLGLIKHINKDFGVDDADSDLDDELAKLSNFVLKENEQGNNCAIIIDDAQNLSWESLEIIRMISNLEGNSQKLVQILLIGQPELADKLNSQNLRQLKSRIVIQREITTLPKQGLQKYLDFKLTVTGPTRLATSDKVIKAIYAITKGNLRGVNILMDRCLYIAYAEQSQLLTPKMIHQAAADLKMAQPSLLTPMKVAIAALILIMVGIGTQIPFFTSASPVYNSAPVQELTVVKTTPVPLPVNEFLQGYDLDSHATLFWAGLQKGNLKPLNAEIKKSTGLEMITLPSLPPFLQNMDVLQISDKINKQPRFLFYWRPQLVINDFYIHYQGRKIVQLQYMLADQNYYNSGIDGIVGEKLMQSIVDFQRANDLNVSGIPDQETLFVLCCLTNHSASK